MTVAEILEQVKALSPEERKELAKSLIDMLDVPTVEAVDDIEARSGDEHWGRSLNQLMDEVGPIELKYVARNWVDTQPTGLSVTTITWMEVMEGASSKANQTTSKGILNKFELLYVTPVDQTWAMHQLERFQFSHRIDMNDCQIAAVAYRLQIPLYIKHMRPLLGTLAVQPYA